MSDQTTLILGPSNVGKTALIASFFYSAGVFAKRGFSVQIQAENETTRMVQQNTLSFVRTGRLPFQGTYSIMEYEFLFSVAKEKKGISRFWGQTEVHKNRFRFFDSPGGAIFAVEGAGIDYAVQGEHRKKLVAELQKAQGLILCVDASEQNQKENTGHMSGQLYVSLNDIFSLTPKEYRKGGLPALGIQRVYICINKCDLWAVQEGYQGEAQEQVEELDPLSFAYRLLGKGFFNTITTFFHPNTQIAFGFSSSFGFLEGGPNAMLMEGVGMGQEIRREHLEAWSPYQVLDPFVFLTTGKPLDPHIFVYQVRALHSHLPWGA
ncbi:MAG: hypothetical protein CL916_03320 [Deltaproteobacteria bacterium]|nr:hypothetical protein [Deltaproteobacteria bacterium]